MEEISRHVAARDAQAADKRRHDVREVLTDPLPALEGLIDRRVDAGRAGDVLEVVEEGVVEVPDGGERVVEPADIQLGMPVEVIVAGHGDALDNVNTLAAIGVATVLTHYGHAVGNLVLLESLPVAGVELADPLVRIAAESPDSVVRPALAGMVPLIRRTGVPVVVSGIDSAEQACWWRQIGADSGRGSALAR